MRKITLLMPLFLMMVSVGYSQCDPVTTLNESFDAVTTPALPNCWSKIIRGTNISANAKITTEKNSNSINYAYSATNAVSLVNSTSTGTYDVILVSPKLSTAALNNYRLRFYAKCALQNITLEVGTLDKNTSDAIFTPISTVSSIGKFYNEFKVNFTSHGSNANYIGIRMAKTDTQSQTIFIDNIIWEAVPSCPDVSQVNVPSVSTNSANIVWSVDANANSYDIAVGSSTTNDPSSISSNSYYNTTNKSFNIPDLTQGTTYRAWVRSSCTTGGSGSWFGPVTFKTNCNPETAITESFENVTVQALPACWSKILTGSDLSSNASIGVNGSNGNLSSAALQLNCQNSTKDGVYNIIAVSPNLSTVASGKYRLRFDAKASDVENLILEIGTLNGNTDYATFKKLEQFSVTGNYASYVLDFSSYTITQDQIHIGFRYKNSNIAYRSIFIDNVIWELIPVCADVSQISTTNITDIEAKINWIQGSSETDWDISVREASATEPDNVNYDSHSDTSTATSTKSFVKTGLKPNTDYKVWVRSSCQSGKGLWIGYTTFKTACSATTSINENFDNAIIPNVPDCWSTILKADPNVSGSKMDGKIETIQKTGTYSGPNGVYMSNFGSTNKYDIILTTPALTNLISGTHRLKFYAWSSQSKLKLEIGTLSDNGDPSTFHLITEVAVDVTSIKQTEKVIDFAQYITTDKYIGFRIPNSNNSYTTINLDNIVWEPIPPCPDVFGQKLDFTTTNSAGISWDKETNTKWEVIYATADVTNPDSITMTPIEVTGDPLVVIDNLSAATTYKVWVRSICGDNKGFWSKPFILNTECAAVSNFRENFDDTAVFSLPMCWNGIIRNVINDDSLQLSVSGPNKGATSKPNVLALNCYGNNPSTTDLILVSPKILRSSLEKNLLTFSAKGIVDLAIGVLDKYTNDAVFTELTSVSLKDESGLGQIFTVDLSGKYTGTRDELYIGMRLKIVNGGYVSVYFASVDSINWEPKEEVLATDKFELNNLTYFPNPVNEVLNISNIDNITAVSVHNLLGQEIITKTNNDNLAKIDMSGLSNGTYLVKVTSNNVTKTIKVIKE